MFLLNPKQKTDRFCIVFILFLGGFCIVFVSFLYRFCIIFEPFLFHFFIVLYRFVSFLNPICIVFVSFMGRFLHFYSARLKFENICSFYTKEYFDSKRYFWKHDSKTKQLKGHTYLCFNSD